MVAHRRISGFTLLELLAVLAIIGLIATVVVVSVVGSDHKSIARNEADRLARTVELARREATLRNELWGVMVERNSYQFVSYSFETEEWVPIERRPYMGLTLKENFYLRCTTPENAASEQTAEQEALPNIVIEPTGEITPFLMDVYHDASLVTSSIETDGIKQVGFSQDVPQDS